LGVFSGGMGRETEERQELRNPKNCVKFGERAKTGLFNWRGRKLKLKYFRS